ncbi:MAG: carbohydrate kinase [SAR116 cluster bacterium]|nr:carbohydrate kinase [SAR116 cluster bacterium]HCD64604.1 carbohydrate kinase [Alphaproteobacteria bacterium]|tara:strand:+ start:241 stop:1170 length:930 start_codon:yes stop_codon:yes gene_type:complete
MLFVGGENLIDLVQLDQQDGLPLYQAIPGGSPFNLAIAAGRQGLQTGYLTPISTDKSGDLLAARLDQAGVVLAGGRHPAPSSLAMVTLTNGVPSYSFYRDGTAERQISEDRLTAALTTDARLFHIGSLALAGGADADVWEALSARCKQAGIAVSLDPNVRAGLIADPDSYRARLARMMQLADIIKLSDEDLTWIYPDQSEQDALAQLVKDSGASVLVLTRGENGASLFHDGQWHDEPVAPMDELKDTVGAGDTFMATMLVWLVQNGAIGQLAGLSLGDKLAMVRRAAQAAAINCSRQGCNPPFADEMLS